MTTLVVETEKIISNYNIIAEHTNTAIIGVVKGNGYGLGLLPFARILKECGVSMFAVADIEEAVALRSGGIEDDILLMSPIEMPHDVKLLLDNDITATISSCDGAVLINAVAEASNKKAKVHIKIDTGFGRFGFLPEQIDSIVSIFSITRGLEICGVYTHLSNSFCKNDKVVKKQYEDFMFVVNALKGSNIECGLIHMANSCAALRFDYTRLDAVRIGSGFLGRLPVKNDLGLKKVGYLEDIVSEIRTLPSGHNIGYANVYKTKKPTRIAIIQTGYVSGFGVEKSKDTFRFIDVLRYMWNDLKNLFYDNRPYAIINEKKAYVLGRVSMCNIVVDVSDIDCQIGDTAKMNVNPLFCDSAVVRKYV